MKRVLLLIAVFLVLPPSARANLSECIDATCRITAPDGSRGTGCVFERSGGLVYVLTAAHVVGSQASVECEFWRNGHQSQPLASRVVARSEAADATVVTLYESAFAGIVPPAIPLAPRDYMPRPGETLTSVGYANGAWSTGWKGHALGCDGAELRFVPPPANGRSGSAVFDAEGRQIVGLLRARTGDNAEGIATAVQAIYRAFDGNSDRQSNAAPRSQVLSPQLAQCGPNGCPLFGFRNRRDNQPQPSPQPAPRGDTPWPGLQPVQPRVDVSPLDEKLGRIAGMLEELKRGREPAPQAGGTPAPHATVDEHARKTAEAALSQVADLRGETDRNLRDVKAETAKASEAVGGLTGVVERIKQAIAEDGTLSQRFHARVDRVKGELEEKLGREATDREVRIGYVKDLIQEKVADGGLVGLAKALGLPAGLVFVVWLITRDVKHKRETGDPLVVEKLAKLVEGQVTTLQQRFDALKDRLHTAATATEPPK